MPPTLPRLRDAQQNLRRNRRQSLAEMNAIFREGSLPVQPMHGLTNGQMLAVDIAPGITPLAQALLASRMPWCGKTFDAAAATGNNLLYTGFLRVGRVMFPSYEGYAPAGDGLVSAFPFRTYTGAGLKDRDRQVLKIDYDTPANPRFLIRQILDELVQVDDNYYLGKAYLKLSPVRWHLLFYFALQRA